MCPRLCKMVGRDCICGPCVCVCVYMYTCVQTTGTARFITEEAPNGSSWLHAADVYVYDATYTFTVLATYMCYTLGGGDRLLTLLHCTLHELCMYVEWRFTKLAPHAHVTNTHVFCSHGYSVRSCLYQFHLFIRWETSLEFRCTISPHTSDIFCSEDQTFMACWSGPTAGNRWTANAMAVHVG